MTQGTEPVPGHDHVHFAHREGRPVVVKTGTIESLRREALALTQLGDRAADVVELVEIDGGRARLVTARVLPGDDLRPLVQRDDDVATTIIAEIVEDFRQHLRLPGSSSNSLPHVGAVVEPIARCEDPRLPREVRYLAQQLCDELLGSMDCRVVHGDLQHRNVLRHGVSDDHRWVAIDPHGWLGDPSFEFAAALAAPESLMQIHPEAETRRDARGIDPAPLVAATARRIGILAEISGDDPQRLWAWAFVGAVIAEARMLELHNLVHGAPLSLAQGISARGLV